MFTRGFFVFTYLYICVSIRWVEEDPKEIMRSVYECIERTCEKLQQRNIDISNIKGVFKGTYDCVLTSPNCGWGCVAGWVNKNCLLTTPSREERVEGWGLYWHLCCCFSLSGGCDQSERDDPGLGQRDGRASLQRYWWVHCVSESSSITAKYSNLRKYYVIFNNYN